MADINALSKRLIEIRNERKVLAEQDKILNEEFEQLSMEVLAAMDEMGVDATRSDHASMSRSTQQLPQVTDWDAFYRYVKANDAFYLLQKRVSSKAWSEQLELDGEIPGTEAYEKVKLNLRVR